MALIASWISLTTASVRGSDGEDDDLQRSSTLNLVGRYQGAATELLHWVDADQPDALDP
ncbi:hypothetical protein [Curtobacterium flaccumfaciens]|uniref:hypothetical protein n=1 Tax=Curtobacterium flaccumfaciens TaxID=2035 RepID=UPI00188B99DD|nr:hypothetical protein [Curtobacterium flaccumfaciens]MBF4629349.1 hypothetical protein [Curtobacterium flaccumfaciens]